jgi:hypothetical protein
MLSPEIVSGSEAMLLRAFFAFSYIGHNTAIICRSNLCLFLFRLATYATILILFILFKRSHLANNLNSFCSEQDSRQEHLFQSPSFPYQIKPQEETTLYLATGDYPRGVLPDILIPLLLHIQLCQYQEKS